MKLWTHTINEPPRGRIVWYPRWFFKLYRGPQHGERPILGGHTEFVLSKPTTEFGINFEVGTQGSETPFDGYLKIAGTTLYWGIEQGGRLASSITQLWFNRLPNRVRSRACLDRTCDCPPYNPQGDPAFKRHIGRNGQQCESIYEGRQFQIRTSDSRLWLSIWTRKNGWARGQFAEWRSRTFRLNPADWFFGDKRYWYDNIDQARILIDMPEAVYPVQATLQQQRFGRPKLPKRHIRNWIVDVKADECKGIPNQFDHSGGWKGDRVYGFAVDLKQGNRPDWHIDAKAAIEARILKDRADSGFRKPLPLDAG